MNLKPRLSRGATATPTPRGWRLTIPPGPASGYRLSQLDDHAHIARRNYPYRPPFSLELKARVSSASVPGTWGLGLWNDPFGFSFGPEDNFFKLPALPNALWFFYASPNNHLSFQDNKPAQGFLAQAFRSPRFDLSLIAAGLVLPFSRKKTRQLLSRVIDEDSATVSVDVTQWHRYRFEWGPSRSAFWVDEALVLESPVSPHPPLGLVIWIDNQYAAFTPQGKLSWGLEENSKSEWLEIEDIQIKT
ncbi:MAG: hypothetical protein HY258_13255 [Chloroflexi bacterium]|nr:hypothetical protein [Chloroflexota bacterium]